MGYQVSVLESSWCERVRDRTQAQLLTPISAYINMAYSSNTEGLEAALNASLERQRALVVEPTPKQIQKKWGSNLERVMVSLTAEVERIGKEMERGDHTVAECKAYIDIIHGEKMTLGKIFAQWQRAGGVGADTGVEKTVEAIEQAAENLIKNIRDTLERVRPEKSSVPIPTIEQGASPKTAGIQSTPKQKKPQSEKSHFNNSREITTSSVTPTELTKTASHANTTSHAIITPTHTENSAYVKQLISSRSQGSKKGSKRSSKAGSKASSAAKLKLRFDEVEAKIDAEFSAEASARSQRVLVRNENKAEQERKRQAERVETEQRRQREQLESELRERRLREKLETEQREQREQLEQEHRRHEEQLKLERERIEEEAAEREASIRKKEAMIRAKKIALETFIEENSVGEGSLSLGVTEIAPSEKVKAYVSQAVKFEPEVCGQVNHYEVVPVEPVTIPKLNFTNNIRNAGEIKSDYSITTNTGATGSVHDRCMSYPYKGHPTYTAPTTELRYAWAPDPVRVASSSSIFTAKAPKDEQCNSAKWVTKTPVSAGITGTLNPLVEPERVIKQSNYKPSKRSIGVPSKTVERLVKIPVETKSSPENEQNDSRLPNELTLDPFSPLMPESIKHENTAPRSSQNRLQSTAIGEPGNTDRVIEAMCDQLTLTRLPFSEPGVFDGRDPLRFTVWKKSFDALIKHRALSDSDKLSLLSKYLSGAAYTAIQGYLFLESSEAFKASYKILNERYGDNFIVASTLKERLKTWPKFGGTDSVGLRNFVDFLRQCETAKRDVQALKCLDEESENLELMRKLPSWLCRQWRRKVSAHREATGEFPPFGDFVEFLAQEDKIAHDPLSRSWQKIEGAKEKRNSTSLASGSREPSQAAGGGAGRNFGTCIFCRGKHSLQVCEEFGREPFETRMQFVRNNQLCFSCLIGGHISRNCRNKKTCEICQRNHPTNLHRDENQTGNTPPTIPITACASNNNLGNTPQKSSMVLPVRVSHISNPEREQIVYAMLDSQSDSTFITEGTARALGLQGVETRLSLSTMTASDKVVRCQRYGGLEIQGFSSNQKIPLPPVFSRRVIPINYQHIPCPEMVDYWPHLEDLRDKITPRMDVEVGLLIGYDCSRALEPLEVVSAPKATNGPFGQRTELGWGIVGVISQSRNTNMNPSGYSHHIVANQITESQIVLQRYSKEVSPIKGLQLLDTNKKPNKKRRRKRRKAMRNK